MGREVSKELNEHESLLISVFWLTLSLSDQAHSFEVAVDSTSFHPYLRGGLATQVKETKVLKFRPLSEALQVPGDFLLTDFAKLDRPTLLHIAFQALDAFQARQFPTLFMTAPVHLTIETRFW